MDQSWLDEAQSIMIDMGSSLLRAGFCGDDAPRASFPSVVGKPKYKGVMVGMDSKDCFVGDECISKSSVLNCIYPIRRGWFFEENLWDIERLLHHTPYNELCVATEEHPYVLSECVMALKSSREKLTELLFEVFNVPATCFALAPYLSHMATGKTCNILNVDVGAGVSQIMSVGDSPDDRSYFRSDLGGNDVDSKFYELLKKSGQIPASRDSTMDLEKTRIVKERHCVCEDKKKKKEDSNDEPQVVTFGGSRDPNSRHRYWVPLPDSNFVRLTTEHIEAPEVLFTPSKSTEGRRNRLSVPQLVHKAFVKSFGEKEEYQKNKKIEIVLNGGTTFLKGFEDRLFSDFMSMLDPESYHSEMFSILSPEARKYHTWIGGSILGSMTSFSKLMVLKEMYDEEGIRVSHKSIVK